MIRMTFQSGLKEKEKQFVAFKQQFGYTYEARIYNLLDFDRFCAANYPGRDTLDRDIVLKWAVIRPTETANGFATRISAVRQFGKYLVMLGEDAYIIPDGFRGGDMPLMPYIFSEATLRQFLGYTDSMERYYQSTVRHLVAPVMFRFMYCCGLVTRHFIVDEKSILFSTVSTPLRHLHFADRTLLSRKLCSQIKIFRLELCVQ